MTSDEYRALAGTLERQVALDPGHTGAVMVAHHRGADGKCEGCHRSYPCPDVRLQAVQHVLDDHQSPFAGQFKAFIRDDAVLARCERGHELSAPEPIAPYRMLDHEQQWRVALSNHRAADGAAS